MYHDSYKPDADIKYCLVVKYYPDLDINIYYVHVIFNDHIIFLIVFFSRVILYKMNIRCTSHVLWSSLVQ